MTFNILDTFKKAFLMDTPITSNTISGGALAAVSDAVTSGGTVTVTGDVNNSTITQPAHTLLHNVASKLSTLESEVVQFAEGKALFIEKFVEDRLVAVKAAAVADAEKAYSEALTVKHAAVAEVEKEFATVASFVSNKFTELKNKL